MVVLTAPGDFQPVACSRPYSNPSRAWQFQVRMYQAMKSTDTELVRMLLECGLTVTFQTYYGSIAAVAARSFKVSEEMRKLPSMADSFLVFVRRLYAVLPIQDLPITKAVEKVAQLQKSHGSFTYGGVKVDKNVLGSAAVVMKNMASSAEALLDHLQGKYDQVLSHSHTRMRHIFRFGPEVGEFAVGYTISVLNRKVASIMDFTDSSTDDWSKGMKAMFEIVTAVAAVIKASDDGSDALKNLLVAVESFLEPQTYDRAKVEAIIRTVPKVAPLTVLTLNPKLKRTTLRRLFLLLRPGW